MAHPLGPAFERVLDRSRGPINAQLVCSHCGEQGHVRTKRATVKTGISGAKATGALLTGGVSVLATGLSRKQKVTQAYCGHCESEWSFA